MPEHHRQSSGRRRVATAAAAAGSASGSSGAAADHDAPASDSPAAEAAHARQQQGKQRRRNSQHPALEAVNDATKWAVSAAAFGTLLWRRDLLSAFGVLGSIVAAINCRVLKFLINQARPSARKADPGMPSAHANSLAFLATFVALAAAAAVDPTSPLGLALVVGVPTLGIFLAWLRVALGYHTVAQVAVGWVVGGGSAAAWHAWGRRTALPAVQQSPQLQAWLYGITAAAVAFFIFSNVRRWVREAQAQRLAASSAGYSSDWA